MTKANPARILVSLAVGALAWSLCSNSSRADAEPRCLTPDAGRALQTLVAQGVVAQVLGENFTLENVSLTGQTIVVSIEDRAQHRYQITLASPDASRGSADAQGRQFAFYVAATNGPAPHDARAALLAIAARFDQAIPDTALINCSGRSAPSPPPQESIAGTTHRAVALISAAVQVIVVLVATLLARYAIRRRTIE